jgi:transposase
LVRKQGDLTEDERVVKQALLDHCQEIQRTWNLAADFVQMLRERRSESLDSWLDRATGGDTAPSLRRFAEGLKKDLAAVTAALSLRWNNGPAEGHISRLKMLKRQMYGRAHFDLLRARFLYAA